MDPPEEENMPDAHPGAPQAEKRTTSLLKLTVSDVLEDELLATSKIEITQPAYLELKNRHHDRLQELQELRRRPPEDLIREEAQDRADAAECARLDALMPILRSSRRSALCFSGGGIRSATFGLGVLQGLARYGVLRHFDYLSTVSGGGYIGSWLSAWLSHPTEVDGVETPTTIERIEEELAAKPVNKVDGELGTIEHLRSYSNYLSPRLGVFSADTWTLAATVVRNMFLNWMVLVPILAVVLLIPKLLWEIYNAIPTVNWLSGGRAAVPATLLRISPPGWVYWLAQMIHLKLPPHEEPFFLPLGQWSPWLWMMTVMLVLGLIPAVIAVRNIAGCLPSANTTKVCSQEKYLSDVLAPLSLSALCLNLFWAAWHRPGGDISVGLVIGFGALLHWLGWWLFLGDDPSVLQPTAGAEAVSAERMKEDLDAEGRRSGRLWRAAITGGIGGWVAYLVANTKVGTDANLLTCFAFPIVMGIYFFATALFIGLDSRRSNDEDREWWARSGGWILTVSIGWMIAAVLVVYGHDILQYIGSWVLSATGLASGIGGSLAGRSAKTAASKESDQKHAKSDSGSGSKSSLSSLFSTSNGLKIVTAIAPVVFLFVLLVGISELCHYLIEKKVKDWLPNMPAAMPISVLILLGIAAGIALFMSLYVNVNTFSLSAMYRARLIRAYLGASHPKRKPNPFTGFDPGDNLHMHQLPNRKPLHVINMALNLVHGKRLAWQERKAETFTVTRLHAGSIRVGYQPSATYGGRKDKERQGGITLGTAMAISGAAASPNMGYHSSPLLGFLMTFFNARLGWWLANPGYPGYGYWRDAGPKSALRSLISEALGDTDDENRYVYLSDGGHFENLGLYEMILRRCTSIVVIDAGADPAYQFEDLANALRKIRVDLGVRITFDPPKIEMSAGTANRVYCAKAIIHYDEIDQKADQPKGAESTLLYIKPLLTERLSVDLMQYHSVHSDFPQQTTADQFFDEAQFESYRRLGFEAIESIAGANTGQLTIEGFLGKGCGPVPPHEIRTDRL
jgi:Patatin-like phospholipase